MLILFGSFHIFSLFFIDRKMLIGELIDETNKSTHTLTHTHSTEAKKKKKRTTHRSRILTIEKKNGKIDLGRAETDETERARHKTERFIKTDTTNGLGRVAQRVLFS